MNKLSLFLLSFLLCITFSFVACGKRGTPEPPSLVVPAKIDDFRVDVIPGKRQLAWTVPTLNADNSRPVDLKSFKVLLKKLPLDQDSCRYCDEGFHDYLDLSLIKPVQGSVFGPAFYLPLPQIPHGFVYLFSVSSVNSRGWLSEVSNKLAVFSLSSVLSPTKLICQPSASVVELDWQPPILPTYFNGVLSYRVYRRNSINPNQAWQLITPEAIVNPEFIDVGLSDWSSYEYVVTSFITQEGTHYESDFSHATLVVPGDYIPPATPDNFTAFYYQGGIQLIWDPSSDADLSGYRVYRHDSVSGIDNLFAVLLPSNHEFFDTNILSGRTYTYRVTAFDQSDRKNESLPTPEVSVTVR